MRQPRPLTLLPLLLALLLLPLALAADSTTASTLKLAYVPLPTAPAAVSAATPKPQPFATLDLAPAAAAANGPAAPALQSFLLPRDPAALAPLLRVGVLDAAGAAFAGRTTLATGAALAGKADAVVRVVLGAPLATAGAGAAGTTAPVVLAVDVYLDPDGAKALSWTGKDKGMPRLAVAAPAPEPRAVLNRPVVLGEDGKVARDEEKPKTLLQRYVRGWSCRDAPCSRADRYWWVAAIVVAISLMGGGGDGKE